MTKYIPRTTCKKLVRMGCVSESGFFWPVFYEGEPHGPYKDKPYFNHSEPVLEAFTPWDFVGTSKQARDNARILWVNMSDPYPCSRTFRHDCIDSKDAVEFIVRSVEAKEKVI